MKVYGLITIEGKTTGLAGFKDGCMVSIQKSRPNFVWCNYEFVSDYDYGWRGGSMSNSYLSRRSETPPVKSLKGLVTMARDRFGWQEGKVTVLIQAPQSLYRKEQGEVELKFPLPLNMEAEVVKHEGAIWEYFAKKNRG